MGKEGVIPVASPTRAVRCESRLGDSFSAREPMTADEFAAYDACSRLLRIPFIPVVVESLDSSTEFGDGVSEEIVAALAVEEYGYARVEAEADLRRVKDHLTDAEFEILRLVYCAGLTQAEVARMWGINRMNISRQVATALRRGGEALGVAAA